MRVVDKSSAKQLNDVISEFSRRLSDSVVEIKRACDSDEEWDRYQSDITRIIAISFDLRDKLYREFPDLRPSDYS